MARSKTGRFILAFLVATPLLAACQQLIGVSDYTKDDCSGGGSDCLDASRPDTGPYADGGKDAGDAGPVVFVDAAGSEPVAWAKFKMPNYFQADGIPDASIPTYNNQAGSDAGALVDSVSLLVWRPVRDANEKRDLSYKQAVDLCKNAVGGTWRLPTRIELVTLLDLSKNPTVDPKFGMEATKYWSTSQQLDPARTPNDPGIPTGFRILVGFDRSNTNIITVQSETSTAPSGRAICIQAK